MLLCFKMLEICASICVIFLVEMEHISDVMEKIGSGLYIFLPAETLSNS